MYVSGRRDRRVAAAAWRGTGRTPLVVDIDSTICQSTAGQAGPPMAIPRCSVTTPSSWCVRQRET